MKQITSPSIGQLDTRYVKIGSTFYLTNGTASSPALTFTNDTNSGLYRLAEDKIGLITGGSATKGITIDSVGNVGIGTTNPGQKLAVVTPTYTSDQILAGLGTIVAWDTAETGRKMGIRMGRLNYEGSRTIQFGYVSESNHGQNPAFFVATGSTETERFRISSNGNVGIGTTGPGAKLEVAGSTWLRSTAIPQIRLYTDTDVGGGNYAIIQNPSTDGTATLDFSVGGKANAVRIDNTGNVGIGTTGPGSRLHVVGSGNEAIRIDRVSRQPSIKAGTADGYMIIDSSGQQLRLNNYVSDHVILANGGGNVGIGTSSPGAVLHTYRSSPGATHLIYAQRAGDSPAGSDFYHWYSSYGPVEGGIRGNRAYEWNTNIWSTQDLTLGAGGAGNLHIIIDKDSGNVGIGTTSPGYKLDVAGQARILGLDAGYSSTNPISTNVISNVWIPRRADIGGFIFMDYMDEAFFWDKKYNSISITPSQDSGDTSSLFRDDSSFLMWNSGTSPYPIVIEIDSSSNPITSKNNGYYQLGLTFRSSGPNPTHIKIETWNVSTSAYEVKYDEDVTIGNDYSYWLSPRFSPGASSGSSIHKIKVTLNGTNPLSGNFRLQRFMIYHDTAEYDPWHLHIKGGTLYGGINFSGVTADITTANNEHLALMPNGTGNVGISTTAPDYKLDVNGAIGFTPGSSVAPVDNGDVVIEATDDTTLTFKLKGSDGTVRSATLALT